HAAERGAEEQGRRIGAGFGGDEGAAADDGEEERAGRPEPESVHCVDGEDGDSGDDDDDGGFAADGADRGTERGGEQQGGGGGEDHAGTDAVGAAFAVEDGEGAEGDEESLAGVSGEDDDDAGQEDGA